MRLIVRWATPDSAQPATAKTLVGGHVRPFSELAAIDKGSDIITAQTGVNAVQPRLLRHRIPRLLCFRHGLLLRVQML